MFNKMAINFDPIEGISVVSGEGVLETKKFIEFDDLKDIFMSNVSMETGLLPKGCQYFLRENGKTAIILEQPAMIRTLLYRYGRNVGEYQIPTPNVIFGLVFEAGTLRNSYCAVSKMPIMGLDTEIFRFPLGNVYRDARICWGNASIPAIRGIWQASDIPSIFFEAPFNGDLSHDANLSGSDINEYFTQLNGQEFYPISHLKVCDLATFSDLIDRVKRDVGAR